MEEPRYKLCIFGDGGVGKTTFLNRYCTGVFDEDLKMTIGADFSVKDIEVDAQSATLQIWDFGGEDRYKILFPSFVKGALGGIYMFSRKKIQVLSATNEELRYKVIEDGLQSQPYDEVIYGEEF